MRFSEIKSHIVNREGYESIDAIHRAGYRLVKARDSDRHFLARPDNLQPLLVRLGDIAEVRFGIKTGANEFFYLKPVGTTVAELFRAGAQQPSQPTCATSSSCPPTMCANACTTPPTSSNATQRHTPTSSGVNGGGINTIPPVPRGMCGGNWKPCHHQ
jgi:hypothetical protein